MKKRNFLASLLIGGLIASAPAVAQDFKPMKLKVASNYPATSLFSRVQQHYFDQVTKKTGGKVTFEWFYGGVLLKATDVFPGISRGVVDIGFSVPAAFNPREYPISDIMIEPPLDLLDFRLNEPESETYKKINYLYSLNDNQITAS